MGNVGSSSGGNHGRRRNSSHDHLHDYPSSPTQPSLPPQPPEIAGNRYLYASTSPYPQQYPNPSARYPNPNAQPYYQYPGYYRPPPIPAPFDPRSGPHQPNWGGGGRYPYAPPPPPAPPYVEHQRAVTIRNDVNLKKETLKVEPDDENPGRFLVSFTFDATVAGSITVYFFAKEGFDSNLVATKETSLAPITVSFQEGLGQKFRQPSGTGIDFSMFEEVELTKEGDLEVYPLVVKAEASPSDDQRAVGDDRNVSSPNSQITQAVFEKRENSDYRVRVVKQILWVNGTRYVLQEIYGIGNSVDDFDGNDPGKECVICLSEPRDTTVLPCRHMCMCSGCAKVLRLQSNRCPICRQPVEQLLEIKVNNQPEDQQEVDHD